MYIKKDLIIFIALVMGACSSTMTYAMRKSVDQTVDQTTVTRGDIGRDVVLQNPALPNRNSTVVGGVQNDSLYLQPNPGYTYTDQDMYHILILSAQRHPLLASQIINNTLVILAPTNVNGLASMLRQEQESNSSMLIEI
jgi:hypothetical protein